MRRGFQLVDVFNDRPYSGNPLAVVLDSTGILTEEMHRITRWLNLSETTFLSPPTTPEADYRVRIFTLDRELPFAGHPTLGSCHAWLLNGGKPRRGAEIVQECGAGLIRVRQQGERLAFAAPPLLRGGSVEESHIQELAKFLRIDRAEIIDAQWADNGPGWVAVLLESAAKVLDLKPAASYPSQIDLGVVGAYPAGGPLAFELRAFFTDPQGALREDPVTGSLNASTAQWLIASGRARPPYVASQGTCLGRTGRIHIDVDERGCVWVGGKSSTLFTGHFPG